MDEVYEEFKGTGNMELHPSRVRSLKTCVSAIDYNRSGTRSKEELSNHQEERQKM